MQPKVRKLPRWLSDKESTGSAGDAGSVLGSGRAPGEGNGSPLWYSYMGNPMDREPGGLTVHEGAKELDMKSDLAVTAKVRKFREL